MNVEIHRQERPAPITGVTLTLDVEQMSALLDFCNFPSSALGGFTLEKLRFSSSAESAKTALFRLWGDIPQVVKDELRRRT